MISSEMKSMNCLRQELKPTVYELSLYGEVQIFDLANDTYAKAVCDWRAKGEDRAGTVDRSAHDLHFVHSPGNSNHVA